MAGSLVRDVMTTEVVTAEPSTPFKEIVARLTRHRISAVPVVDPYRRVVGIVTDPTRPSAARSSTISSSATS